MELKSLYVACTRARSRLLIFESGAPGIGVRAVMDFLSAAGQDLLRRASALVEENSLSSSSGGLVRCVGADLALQQQGMSMSSGEMGSRVAEFYSGLDAVLSGFAQKSNYADFLRRGEEYVERQLWPQARSMFQAAGDTPRAAHAEARFYQTLSGAAFEKGVGKPGGLTEAELAYIDSCRAKAADCFATAGLPGSACLELEKICEASRAIVGATRSLKARERLLELFSHGVLLSTTMSDAERELLLRVRARFGVVDHDESCGKDDGVRILRAESSSVGSTVRPARPHPGHRAGRTREQIWSGFSCGFSTPNRYSSYTTCGTSAESGFRRSARRAREGPSSRLAGASRERASCCQRQRQYVDLLRFERYYTLLKIRRPDIPPIPILWKSARTSWFGALTKTRRSDIFRAGGRRFSPRKRDVWGTIMRAANAPLPSGFVGLSKMRKLSRHLRPICACGISTLKSSYPRVVSFVYPRVVSILVCLTARKDPGFDLRMSTPANRLSLSLWEKM